MARGHPRGLCRPGRGAGFGAIAELADLTIPAYLRFTPLKPRLSYKIASFPPALLGLEQTSHAASRH